MVAKMMIRWWVWSFIDDGCGVLLLIIVVVC